MQNQDNTENTEETSLLVDDSIIDQDIVLEMKDSYLSYAMSVIISRAIPDVRDGLKPVHRRILFAMYKLGITPGGKFVKSARVVGEVIGKYHPHGDTAVYDSMVRMAQDFSMRYQLVKGQGNFGSIDGDNAAAMRYTEVKMQKITVDMITDIEKETVAFRDNYDGAFREPTVFPSKLPTLLLNGTMGIAVGMATNVPPHNLNELCHAINYLLDNEDAQIDELFEFVKGPDFPTSGIIYDIEAIKTAYRTGRGSILMRGRAEIEEMKTKHAIIITELPYQVNKANLIIKISDLVRDKSIIGITEIRDESAKGLIRVVIELKRDAFPNKILNQLYQKTALQSSFGFNIVALVEGGTQPKLLNLKDILEEFIRHRIDVITNRTRYELDLAEKRRHILDGLKKALDSIDAIIKTIRGSQTKEDAKINLIRDFVFTEIQADAILSMRLQTLAGLERNKIIDELALKVAFIAECKDILAKPERIKAIIKEETVSMIDQYGDERKTEIVDIAPGKFIAKDTIPNVPMVVTISEKGYIKRVPEDTYSAQNRGGKGIKGFSGDEDVLTHMFHSKNHNELLFFTDMGRCFKLSVYEIPLATRIARGQALVNFLQLDKDELVTGILDITSGNGKYLFMATTDGIIKKTSIDEFKNVRRSGLIAIKLKKGNLLKWVKLTTGTDQIMLVSREGKSIRFKESDVRFMGRSAAGVRGIRLKGDDKVVEMDVLIEADNINLLVVMENGLAKVTSVKEYRIQTRGGSGVKVANITKKTGKVAGAKFILPTTSQDLLLMSNKGLTIRVDVNNIPSKGRATQGVIIMRMNNPGDTVSNIALIPKEDIEDSIEKTNSDLAKIMAG